MAIDVSGQVDTSAIADGETIDPSDVTTPIDDIVGIINNLGNGAQDVEAIQFDELGSDPTTPATGKWRLYAKAGGLYVVDDAGVVTGPFGAGGAGDASGVTFTPTTLSDWTGSADPGNVDDALDQLADRVTVVEGGGGGGGAPDNATFITQTPSAGLTAEQALSTLGTGLLKNTTGTGVLSIAVAADVPDLPASKITSGTFDAARLPAMVGDSGSGGTQGAVPAPGSGDATNFLRGDGTWAAAASGGGDLAEIVANTVLGSAASSISLTTIPGTYAHLMLICRLRSDRAGQAQDALGITFNGDTGNNYEWVRTSINNGGGSAGDSGTSAAQIAPTNFISGATAAAGTFSNVVLIISNYAQTGYSRSISGSGGVSVQITHMLGMWSNTANAITQIDLEPVIGSNFIAGSSYSLYGIG